MNDIKTIEELRAYHERLKAVLEALTELQNRPSLQPSIVRVNTNVTGADAVAVVIEAPQ